MKKYLETVRNHCPLVHNITNYVTVNDVANIILACGASPIMADEPEEVQEITTICQGLNINIGTLHKSSIESMFLAGKKANELGHPVLLDPVGAGASTLRTQTAVKLMQEVRFSVIRGNMSEIKVLSGGMGGARGVDACETDIVTEETLEEAVAFVKAFAKSCGCIVAVTGAIDLVADDKRCYVIRNGRKEMGQITGTGCMLGMVCATYLAVTDPFTAALSAAREFGTAGERAEKNSSGPGSFQTELFDQFYNLL
jgi:hydroxyethylthiazole kinase